MFWHLSWCFYHCCLGVGQSWVILMTKTAENVKHHTGTYLEWPTCSNKLAEKSGLQGKKKRIPLVSIICQCAWSLIMILNCGNILHTHPRWFMVDPSLASLVRCRTPCKQVHASWVGSNQSLSGKYVSKARSIGKYARGNQEELSGHFTFSLLGRFERIILNCILRCIATLGRIKLFMFAINFKSPYFPWYCMFTHIPGLWNICHLFVRLKLIRDILEILIKKTNNKKCQGIGSENILQSVQINHLDRNSVLCVCGGGGSQE